MSSITDFTQPVIGMVHLDALPGSPGFNDNRSAIRDAMRRDAKRLVAGGIDAILVENFGNTPFHADDVPKHTVATMSALVEDIQRVVDVPIGVNVLRNDAKAALSIAAATAASFIRVNVHVGTRVTDQGIVTGHAAETLRLREHLRTDVEILADISVKHSAPVAERPLTETVTDSIKRGHADGIIATGVETGREIDRDHLNAVVDARDDLETDIPVFVGSGVTRETIADILERADGAIVGTDLKIDGETTAPVDEDRVRELINVI